MHKRIIVEAIIGWIIRMTMRYGGIVYDDNGKAYDWGQALIRTQVGDDWVNAGKDDNLPDDETLRIAYAWEDGKWPEWVASTGNHPWDEKPTKPYHRTA